MRSPNRISLIRISQLLAVGLSLIWLPSAWSQAVVASIPTGIGFDIALAENPVTKKIYVAGRGSPFGPCEWHPGNVAVVDEATNSATLVDPNGVSPRAVAVNSVTNKIYVADYGDITPLGCGTNPGKVTVLDGATNTATDIIDPNATGPIAVAVNSETNQIYVANWLSGNVTVIDGATNAVTTLGDPNATFPFAVAVNSATNKTYIANEGSLVVLGTNPGNVSVIDGATNAITTVTDPNAFVPDSVAINPMTNKIYVANMGSFLFNGSNQGNVTVIDGDTNATTTIADPNAFTPGGGDSRGFGVAVNSVTNKIYVANEYSHNVTVIDGVSNSTTTVTDPNARAPVAVAVDSVSNKIYLANMGDDAGIGQNVTVIDGETNSTTTLTDPNAAAPDAVIVNPTTNMIYVANSSSGNVTVIDGGAAPTNFTLSVNLAGSGSGLVVSGPVGIDCPRSCSAIFTLGTNVNLTASPAVGSEFTGWGGPCSGTGACNITLNGDELVTATFALPDFSLTPLPGSLTVQTGGQVTDTITLAPLYGSFETAIQLSCAVAGPAPMPTCAMSPTSVTPGANSVTSTLTIAAPMAATAALASASQWRLARPLYAICSLLLFATTLAGRSKKPRCGSWMMFALFFALLLFQVACGGSTSTNTTIGSTNYTVTVTAISGAIQHTAHVAVTVQ